MLKIYGVLTTSRNPKESELYNHFMNPKNEVKLNSQEVLVLKDYTRSVRMLKVKKLLNDG